MALTGVGGCFAREQNAEVVEHRK